MPSFLNELKRRNVLRVAGAYALVAWILIEAGSVLLPTFGVPDWFFRVYVILIFAGFVVSLIIAWVFEITPDGVRLESELDREAHTPAESNSGNFVLIGLLVVALVISIGFNISGIRDKTPAPGDGALSSVAVLPFDNRSTDPENGYFADGIHDDLLTRLADIDSLHVISRTSVNEYRGTAKHVSVIGEELGVAAIVQGAVQRSGDQIRISVSLIDAQKDRQLWAQTYDEDANLQSVFELQTLISSQITESLRAELTPEEREQLASIPTSNEEAYRLFVQGGINLGHRRFDTLVAARAEFEQAIRLDPEFADAYAALAETIMVLLVNHDALLPEDARELASDAVNSALRLDPNSANAHAVRGMIAANRWMESRLGTGNIEAADDYRKALALNSNLSNAYVWFSTLRENENDTEAAIELLGKALEVDPLNRVPFVNLPGLLALRGDNEACTELLLRAVQYFPNWELPYLYLSEHLLRQGRLDEGVAWSVEEARISEDPLAGSNVLGILRRFEDTESINAFMNAFPDDHPVSPIGAAFERFINGDYASTLDLIRESDIRRFGGNGVIYPVLIRAAILVEDYPRARQYIMRSNPRFAADQKIAVDRFNLTRAILLAFVEQKEGNTAAASAILDAASKVVATLPRTGYAGHGIRDVQILSLQGKIPSALEALREAIDAGFVSEMAFDLWDVDEDPLLAPLRDQAPYLEMKKEMQDEVERMRANVQEARLSGDWSELRALVGKDLRASVQ